MNTKDHGVWQRYTPETLPKDAPANAMFTRRESDGADWYDYVNSGDNFAADSVKMTLRNNIVGAATSDPTALFPGDDTVLEVFDVALNDPQKTFGGKLWDGENFSDPPPPPDVPDTMADLVRRLEALEARKQEG